MIETLFSRDEVDILMFAEGTYPYVKGGVSQWIYEVVSSLSEYKFGIVFLGAFEGLYTEPLYPLPENVVHLQIIYLFQKERNEHVFPHKAKAVNQKVLEKIKICHDIFKSSRGYDKGLSCEIDDIGKMIDPENGFDYYQFLHSKESWDYITEQYSTYSTDPSFIDYFWNIRNLHAPLWRMEEMVRKAPSAKILHAISTGYAGMLATMIHQRKGISLILSEHGLYSKERNIELLQTTMFPKIDKLIASTKTFNYIHSLWLNFYYSLGRVCYHFANPIISLYEAARIQQHLGGADINKTKVIPNGVDIQRFAPLRRPREAPIPKIVCFVGRIVRIKDIKTLISAAAIMVSKDENIKVWIKSVGSDDDEYLKECLDLIQLLGLEKKITIIYEGGMLDVLPKIGVLILSSISEGMPLVLLEAMAAGIPVIATSVGACKEIIEGHNDEDRQLGTCGAVVSIVNTQMLAEEALNLLNNPVLWFKAQESGIKRVEKYYDKKQMLDSYKKIYNEVLKEWQG